MNKSFLKIAFFGVLSSACTTAVQQPTPADKGPVQKSENIKSISPEEIARGKEIHDVACYKCHDLYKPAEYSDEEWVKIMKSMGPKSHLDPEEYRLVLNYLQSAN